MVDGEGMWECEGWCSEWRLMCCARVCVYLRLHEMSMCGVLVCECEDGVARCGLREGCVWGCACVFLFVVGVAGWCVVGILIVGYKPHIHE